MKIRFLGANRQVTGSRYLLEAAGLRLLIDCGLFQERPFQSRNYDAPPFDPRSINHLLLTHAHLDHCGLIPRLVAQGLASPIHATPATRELSQLVMADSARIQEEDVAYKQKRHRKQGRASPHPYLPLYTEADAASALKLFSPVEYDQPLALNPNLNVTWHDAGHVLGSALLEIRVDEGKGPRRLIFSGDLGMWDQPIVRDPTLLAAADYVVMESTYGDSDHDHGAQSIEDQVGRIVGDTVNRGGVVVVPTFAIERAQELMFYLGRLIRAGKIPRLPVYLDSPMAIDATAIFQHHPECLDSQTTRMIRDDHSPFRFEGLVLSKSVDQSKAINDVRGPCVIMAGAGMCTGGRIKHHLAHHLPRGSSTVMFVGYQGQGTLGREILDGAKAVRIYGMEAPINARIEQVRGLSAHADRSALMRWLGGFKPVPRRLFLTHGEEKVSLALADTVRNARAAQAVDVPQYGQEIDLG